MGPRCSGEFSALTGVRLRGPQTFGITAMARAIIVVHVDMGLMSALDEAVADQRAATLTGSVTRSSVVRGALNEFLSRHHPKAVQRVARAQPQDPQP